MQSLRQWSLARVLLASAGWIVAVFLVIAGWLFWELRSLVASQTGGLGAVSVGISEALIWLALSPALILVVALLILPRPGRTKAH